MLKIKPPSVDMNQSKKITVAYGEKMKCSSKRITIFSKKFNSVKRERVNSIRISVSRWKQNGWTLLGNLMSKKRQFKRWKTKMLGCVRNYNFRIITQLWAIFLITEEP